MKHKFIRVLVLCVFSGIPTSRAATLIVSDDPVIRDQFYNGNVVRERAAVVLRLAKSWFRCVPL